jgi:hypothetical protein
MPTFDDVVARGQATQQEALALIDSLEPVSVESMFGTWRGEEITTGHPLDGMLAATGWYGKQFVDADTVHPLLFFTADRRAVFPVNPTLMPMNIQLPIGRGQSYHRLMTLARPVIGTSKPTARLRMTDYRAKPSATMIYDSKPINDVFRRVSDDTVLGVMDHRGDDVLCFFILRRDDMPVAR